MSKVFEHSINSYAEAARKLKAENPKWTAMQCMMKALELFAEDDDKELRWVDVSEE